MKKTSLKIIGVTLTLAATIAIPAGSVFAQGSGSNAQTKAANQAAKCTTFTTKIEKHITNINAALTKQQGLYSQHDNQVASLISKAQAVGANTTQLSTDLATWEGQTSTIASDRNQVISQLTTLEGEQCSSQISDYRTTLTNIKSEIGNIQSLQSQKKAFWTSTIKPDLNALSTQLKSLKTTN